ncbi:AAA family ATPase [uncultured Halopseudomonas sp.]|uniref:AAA family ATPase n=1 Tax=uncultured Halopseudomonas sp. TaxID=2901193 RepID=UPI0030EE2E3E|tara:strand:+ start:12089 stop:13285 length:1197 start_codon:yes stop_codon:yes gene_type:complete
MMLQMRLKTVLEYAGLSQAELARGVGLSTAAINLLVNRSKYPKSPERQKLQGDVVEWLSSKGVKEEQLEGCFEPAEFRSRQTPGRCNALCPINQLLQEKELTPMLLRKQSLKPQAKQHFQLTRDPFADPRSSEDLFLSAEIRYVRESLYQATTFGIFLAVVGESGSGKSTIRKELHERLRNDSQTLIVIEPYVLGMEERESQGRPLRAADICASILHGVAPEKRLPQSSEARFRAVHEALRESYRMGNRHVLIIEESHSLPNSTLRHLKRFFELEEGFARLLSVVIIGQTELGERLSERNPALREVVQRMELVRLPPLGENLSAYLKHRFGLAGKSIDDVVDAGGIEALRTRLQGQNQHKGHYSMLYPLAVHNLLTAAINAAAEVGADRVDADIVMGV